MGWIYFFILALVFLGSCGSKGPVDEAPATMEIPTTEAITEENLSTDSSVIIQTTEVEPKAPVYAGLIKELLVPCEYDLDGNGTAETINYQVTDPNGKGFNLKIGDAEIEGSGDKLTGKIYAMSMDGTTLQILVEDRGSNADVYSHVYVYQQDELEPAGVLNGEITSYRVQPEERLVTAIGDSEVFQSFYLEQDFTLVNGILTEVPRAFYPMGNEVTARKAIHLTGNTAGNAYTMTVDVGTRLIVLGTDNQQWVCLQDVETGEEGWLQVPIGEFGQILVDGKSESAQDYFDGLYYFG